MTREEAIDVVGEYRNVISKMENTEYTVEALDVALAAWMVSREELLNAQRRKWNDEIHDVVGVYVLPSNRMHDSGFACMDFVAHTGDGRLVRFGGGCDNVHFAGDGFRMDCLHPSKVIHIWNSKKRFYITHDLSSIDFIEEAQP